MDADDLTARGGDVKIRHGHDRVPVTPHDRGDGRVRGGSVVARFPRRTFWQWLRREPLPCGRLGR